MDIKERIKKLGSDFDGDSTMIVEGRREKLRKLVSQYGYDLVCEATGYSPTTLANIIKGHVKLIGENKVNRATYIFDNLKSE